ncbi:MAG: phosphodiester glycosidase family protein, partial [Firmicutes bacterium]|nr:phosphodiester glycosidase family protein [Bacillota bacterium]
MKRKKALRIFIIVIVVILTVFMVLLPFLSYIIYAESAWQPARETAVKLADALELNRGIYRSEADGARLTEQYLTFTPGGSVSPLVVYGHDIYGAASMKTAVRYAEEETGHRVIGAVNGDFYTVETGVSVGMVIREGTLRTSDDGERNVLAFDRDGNATIGVSGLSVSVTGGSLGDALKNIHFNKPLGPYSGAVLFDASFEATDKNTAMKRSVYLTVKSGEMKVGGTLECEVLSTQDIAYENALRSGYLVLSAEFDTIYTAHLDALGTLAPGDTVTIAIEGNDLLLDAENAVGAGELLVENGENVAPAGTSPAPRTAAGIRADGTVLLYTVDGRQENYSIRMTQQELADRLIELGCVSAVNLDGGGSTTLEAVRPGDEALSLINQPSAGSLRSCANYILFLNTKAATGNLAHLHLYPLEATMLPGASVAFDVLATDSAYWPVTFQASTATFRTDGLGTMRETVFTAGDTVGSGTLTARFGSASGTAK